MKRAFKMKQKSFFIILKGLSIVKGCLRPENALLNQYLDLYVQSNTLFLNGVFENFKNVCFEICEPDPVNFLPAPGLAWQLALKNTKVKLDLLTGVNILLMVEIRIRVGICDTIHRYAKTNNKYMKSCDKNKASSYLNFWGWKDLYRWAMSQKLPVNAFKWVKSTSQFNIDFIKNYSEESDKGYFHETDVQQYLLFLPAKIRIKKVGQLVIHIKSSKQALNHGLVLKKVHRVIKFNQKAWLKRYIGMNTGLGKNVKNWIRKIFFQVDEQCSRYQTCNNWIKKELFSIWNKLSNNDYFFRKFIGHTTNIHE